MNAPPTKDSITSPLAPQPRQLKTCLTVLMANRSSPPHYGKDQSARHPGVAAPENQFLNAHGFWASNPVLALVTHSHCIRSLRETMPAASLQNILIVASTSASSNCGCSYKIPKHRAAERVEQDCIAAGFGDGLVDYALLSGALAAFIVSLDAAPCRW
jgi:hypothetical protein